MNSSNHAGETLFSAACSHVSRHFSVSSIVISVVLAFAGVASFYGGMASHESSDAISMSLFTLGTIFILISVYRFFWKSKEMVYTVTGSPVSEGSCYFDSCDFQSIRLLLEKGTFEGRSTFSFKQNGNVRLDYLLSKDGQFVAVQLFQFVPYAYEPATSVYYFQAERAESFARYFKMK